MPGSSSRLFAAAGKIEASITLLDFNDVHLRMPSIAGESGSRRSVSIRALLEYFGTNLPFRNCRFGLARSVRFLTIRSAPAWIQPVCESLPRGDLRTGLVSSYGFAPQIEGWGFQSATSGMRG
jgi:hypothetical protein